MLKVIKRNNRLEDFNGAKIESAIADAFANEFVPVPSPYVFNKLMLNIMSLLNSKVHNNKIHIKDIYETVDQVLSESGYYRVAKAYMLNYQRRDKVNQMSETGINFADLMAGHSELKVIKRNKDLVNFEGAKIEQAMLKAFEATGIAVPSQYALNKMMVNIMTLLTCKIQDNAIDIEEIQDAVEQVLAESGYFPVSKAYVLYRQQHKNIRHAADSVINFKELMDGYLQKGDWRVKENSTVAYTLGGLILSNSGAVTANYWLDEIYDTEIAEAHKNCFMHIHDLSMLSGYCAGWSLKQLLLTGIKGVAGRISSAPACHLSTLCNQMVNFLGIMQNEWAGAQAFSSFDTYLAPFVKVDNLSYKATKQAIQSFVFGVNTPSRWGTQAPFTNVTLDWKVPDDLKDLPAIVGGKEMEFTYGDCQAEMDMINKAFIEIMIEGDSEGRGFQYPIPTYSITKDFDWSDTENNRLLFEMTAKYGTPYFSNYVNSDMEPSDIRSMCCRLRLDLKELRRKNGGFFGSGDSTGSVGVVTLNLPHIAYVSPNEDAFWRNLDALMDIAAQSLDIKRRTITSLLDAGLYPYTKAYLGSFDNHFSTIGLVGGNEMCLNAKWLGKDLTHKQSQDFVERMLNHMRERLVKYQERYHALFNLEATPAESTAYRFAKHDKKRYPDIITANENGTPYYTNSTNLPVGSVDDVFDALDVQNRFQPLYTSGTVFHTFLGEKLPDWMAAASLVKTICANYKLPYISISPTYSVCSEHGYLAGEHIKCPHCDKTTEVYSRITGYYRPVQNWNDGKAQEFKDRHTYNVNKRNAQTVCDCDTPMQTADENVTTSGENVPAAAEELLLFTTPICPNCVIAKKYLDECGITYRVIDAVAEADLARKHGIMAAPTLVVDGKNIAGAGPIRGWAMAQKEE